MQKTFYIYTAEKNKKSDYMFIKKGFNFYAFIFGFIWFAHNKLWKISFVMFCLFITLLLLTKNNIIDSTEKLIIDIGVMFLVGISANDIKVYYLKKLGYIKKNTIIAKNILEAKKSFYNSLLNKKNS